MSVQTLFADYEIKVCNINKLSNIKKITKNSLLILFFLTGCAAQKKTEFPKVPEFNVHAMTRSEVVAAINECEGAGMKSFVEYLSQKTEYGKVLVPVNVHCNPVKRY
jgi:hypothetical protein